MPQPLHLTGNRIRSVVHLIWVLRDSDLTQPYNAIGMWLLHSSQHNTGGKSERLQQECSNIGKKAVNCGKMWVKERQGWSGILRANALRKKKSEGEGSYSLQTLEIDTMIIDFFFSFVIQKNACKENEVGKWKEQINKCIWNYERYWTGIIPVARVGIINLSYLAFLSGQNWRKLQNGKILHWSIG